MPKSLTALLLYGMLWLSRTKCDFYCEDKSGVCLYTNHSYTATSWEEAQRYCSRNGSILLEVYDENYRNITLAAFVKFNKNYYLVGYYLLLGLEYINGQFRWLTTKRSATQLPINVGNFNGTCKAFIVWNGSQLNIEPSCGNLNEGHRFICLKDKTNPTTKILTSEMTTKRDTSSTSQSVLSIQPISFEYNDHRSSEPHQQNNNIAIGVGVGVTLLIIIISLIIFIVILLKRRSKKAKNVDSGTLEFANGQPPVNPSNGASLVYADLEFKGNISVSKKPIFSTGSQYNEQR